MSAVYKVFPMVIGNTMNSNKVFMERLKSKVKIEETNSANDCNVIIAFISIVSRAGTDIQAALKKISTEHPYKKIILVSLHHTFDPHYIAPDSRYSVNRNDVFAVDCLHHEDQGLLNSSCNDEALKRITKHLIGDKPSNQVFEQSWISVVYNKKLIDWILAVLSIFLVYLALPEGYTTNTILIFELILLTIIAFHPNSQSYSHNILRICIVTNIVLFLIYCIWSMVKVIIA